MRIISTFRDYYDSVQLSGVDYSLIFKRVSNDTKLGRNCFPDLWKFVAELQNHERKSHGIIQGPSYSVFPLILGFCGNLFPMIQVLDDDDPEQLVQTFHDLDSYWRRLCEIKEEFGRKFIEGNSVLTENKARIKEYFANASRWPLQGYFASLNAPYFALRFNIERELVIQVNPLLSELGFFAVRDPYTAYQDIAMYLSGVLTQIENKEVNISDADKIAKRGFDKNSFRKPPSKKTKRKKTRE